MRCTHEQWWRVANATAVAARAALVDISAAGVVKQHPMLAVQLDSGIGNTRKLAPEAFAEKAK